MSDTPFLVVDEARMDANLATLARRAARSGLAVRPHAKTHKCVEIARRQMAHGATGLTVATIGEAETFAHAAAHTGCADLFIAYPLWVTPARAARLRALADIVALRLAVDSVTGARQLAAELGNVEVEVLVEVDSGQHRTGTVPGEAGALARTATDLGLDVVGVFTFPGHGYGLDETRREAAEQEAEALLRAAESLDSVGVQPRVLSGGSTPTAEFADSGVLTEIRPGVYPFNDAQQVEIGACGWDDVALTAEATVVHRSGSRIVLDAGSKILGADRAPWATGFGRILELPDARITALSEHHAVVELADDDTSIVPGSILHVIPNHVCAAVNLVDDLVARRAGSEAHWPVAARGHNQ